MILARIVTLADNYYKFTPVLKLFPWNVPSNKKLPLFVSVDFRDQTTVKLIIFAYLILSDQH